MPIGKVEAKTGYVGSSFTRDPMTNYAQSFAEFAQNLRESAGMDIFDEPKRVLRRPGCKQALKEFFCSNFMDEADPFAADPNYVEDQRTMMEQQFENDCTAVFAENAVMADYNPVIGMTFPVHKNILMNMVFDKGAIQKVVAEGPKFTMSMEKRILVDKAGNEIDMFLEQNKIAGAIDEVNPKVDIVLNLPELGTTNVIQALGGTALDSLSIKTFVSAIQLAKVYIAEGDVMPDKDNVIRRNGPIATATDAGEYTNVWYPVDIRFTPGYGPYERTFNQPIEMVVRKSATENEKIVDMLAGTMDKGVFTVVAAASKIKAVLLAAELDTANHMAATCSVKWHTDHTIVEIPNAKPINVTISPEEVKDLAALYQVNQLTKIMGLMKTVLAEHKDSKIKEYLDESYETMPDRNRGFFEFDYAPPTGYALDPLTWRHSMFFDAFDSEVTKMLQVLNDPNMIVTVFGDPDLVRKITPVKYQYQSQGNIGPVDLDYKRTVVTSDNRVYQFIGSDKLRWNDKMIIILCPHNTNRIVYRIYDYQMYVSNEIRNSQNPALPAVTCFERYLVDSYQPVQSRVLIKNRSGIRPSAS